jgi:hypothetical protein
LRRNRAGFVQGLTSKTADLDKAILMVAVPTIAYCLFNSLIAESLALLWMPVDS